MKFFDNRNLVQFLFTVFAILLLMQTNTVLAGPSQPTSVPEPGPMGLLVLGGVALLIAKRFTRNK